MPMEKILDLMQQRKIILKKAIAQASRFEGEFPDGKLRVVKKKSNYYCYHIIEKDDTNGKYICVDNFELIEELANKEYNSKFLNYAKIELAMLEKCISRLSLKNADLAYQNLSEYKKIFVKPYIQTDEQYALQWQNKSYRTNQIYKDEKIYETKRGEMVRSKSEAILADIFYDLGIPYRYEQAVTLEDGTVRYPDFTLLKKSSRREIYFEHFGLLDDEEYRKSNLNKLDKYRSSGIYLGYNLLMTYETKDNPLDIKGIRKMIKTIFLDS